MVGGSHLGTDTQTWFFAHLNHYPTFEHAVSSSPEIINHYFDLLESTIIDNYLLGKPSQIFNMDETGMPLDPNPPFVVAPVGAKHVSCMRTGGKSQITVIACCS